MNQPKILFEDSLLRISYDISSDSDRCLIAFTGVGHGLGGIDVQREEFISQAALGMVIWVTDKQRSWGNNLDLESIAAILQKLINGKKIFVIGNSMGGFLGILMSRILKASHVMCFTPQFSISKSIVAEETRWMKYRKQIKNIRHLDLSESFSDDCNYAILVGSGQQEDVHTRLFKQYASGSKAHIYQFLGAEHNVASYLKDAGVLNESIERFFSGRNLVSFFQLNNIALA